MGSWAVPGLVPWSNHCVETFLGDGVKVAKGVLFIGSTPHECFSNASGGKREGRGTLA